jgi:hypothetical protein
MEEEKGAVSARAARKENLSVLREREAEPHCVGVKETAAAALPEDLRAEEGEAVRYAEAQLAGMPEAQAF